MLTPQDIQNLLALINAAPITGGQSETVTVLKHKLNQMLVPKKEESKPKNVPVTPVASKKN